MANSIARKVMRHGTIGFSVVGDFTKLEKANKLMDKMLSKSDEVNKSMDKMFNSGSTSRAMKAFEKMSQRASKVQESVDKVSKSQQQMAKTTEKATSEAFKSVEKFEKIWDAVDDRKELKITSKFDKAKLEEARSAYAAFDHINPHVKLSSNVYGQTQKDTEAVRKFSTKATALFKNAGHAASTTMAGGISKAKTKLSELNKTAGQSRGLFSKVFASTLVSSAVLSSWSALTSKIKEAMKAGMDYEKAQDQMAATWTTLAGSRKKALGMRKEINDFSAETGQDTDLVNEEEQGFYHLHSSKKESSSMTHALLNMTDAVGLSKDQAKSVSQDMVHTLSGGVVQTGDLNVIGQYFPMFNEALKKYEGRLHHTKEISGKELRAMAKAGKISAADYEKVFQQLGNVKYGKAAERMMGTFNGMERTIKSQVPRLTGLIMHPFLGQETSLFQAVSKWVGTKKTRKEFSALGDALNTSVQEISGAFAKVYHLKSAPKQMDSFMVGLTKAVTKFGVAVKKHAGDIKTFFDATKAVGGASMKVLVQALKDLLPVLKVVGDFASKHPKLFGDVAAGIILTNGATKLLNGTLGSFLRLGGALKMPLNMLNSVGRGFLRIKTGEKVASDVTPFTSKLVKMAKSAGGVGKTMGTEIWSGLKSKGSSLASAAKKLGGLVKDNFLYATNGIKSGVSKTFDKVTSGMSSVDVNEAAKLKGGWKNNLLSRNVSKMGAVGKLATGAAAVGVVASSGLDIYKGLKAKNPKKKFENFGSGIGTAVGGGIGFFFGGPAGAAIGATIGKFVGKWGGKGAKLFADGWNKRGRGSKPPKGFLPKAGYYAREGGDAVVKWFKAAKKGFKKYGPKVVHFITHPFSDSAKWFLSDTKVGKGITKWGTKMVKKVKSIKIPNPFKNFHPIKWFKNKISNFHPVKWFESLFKGFGKIKFSNPFKNFHPIKWFKDVLSGFHPIKMIKDAFSGGSKAVKKVVKAIGFANGTKGRYPNGLPHDMLAKVNDGGSRELILPPGRQPFMLRGMNKQLVLRKGTHVLNGTDSKRVTGMVHLASGTVNLAPGPALSGKKVKTGIEGTKKKYDKELKGSKRVVSSFKRSSKSDFGKIKSDTVSKVSSTSSKVQKTYKHLKSRLNDITDSISKSWRSNWKSMVNYFGDIFGKLKPFAHKGMAGAISSLNGGFSGIDKALAEFGGNKQVLKPIHYAAGSNGPIGSDQLAILNDAKTGPRQELVVRGERLLKPIGNDVAVPLQKGDGVLNGRQTQKIAGMLPHFAKGTGVSNSKLKSIAKANGGNPGRAFNNEFTVNVKLNGSPLQKGITNSAKSGAKSVGVPWSKAMWGLIQSTVDSGDGGDYGSGSRGAFVREAIKLGKAAKGYSQTKGRLGPTWYDCSGLVYTALKHIGITLPGSTTGPEQAATRHISWGEGKPGDLAFWNGHVGIATSLAGNGRMYNAENPSDGIKFGPIKGFEGGFRGLYRVPGLNDGSSKNKKNSGGKLEKLVKRQLGSKSLKWIKNHLGDDGGAGGNFGNLGGDAVSRWRPYVKKALGMLHLSTSANMIAKVLRQINTESGGNPKAMGGTDGLSDGRAMGLMQVKPGTFKANGGPKFGKWDNGFASIYAGLHYAMNRYGKGLSFLGNGHGYANGGWARSASIFGEVPGEDEVAINPKRSTADGLIMSAIDARAGVNSSGAAGKLKRAISYVKAKKDRKNLYSSVTSSLRQLSGGVNSKSSAARPQIVFSPTISFTGTVTKEGADAVSDQLINKMKQIAEQIYDRKQLKTLNEFDF